MEIDQSFTVGYPLDDVWTSFHDTPGIVACLPGATLTAPPDNGALKLAMTVKLGPIVASFAGDGEMTLDENDRRGSVSGGGVDRKSASRVKGVAAFALHAIGPCETRVEVKVDYTIAGTLAQFSRGGIVKDLATRLTEAFAQNLKAKLDAQQQQNAMRQSAGPAAATDAPAQPVPMAAQPAASAMADAGDQETPAPTALAKSADTESAVSATAASTTPDAARVADKLNASANAAPASPRTTAPPAMPPANAPLDLGNLFWKMLWSRIRGWLRPGVNSR
jgi:uncharacterized protein